MFSFNIYNKNQVIQNGIKELANNAVKNGTQMKDNFIENFIKEAANFKSSDNALDELFGRIMPANSQLKHLDSNVFAYKDYIINIGSIYGYEPQAIGLSKVQDLNLKCAPKLISFSNLKNEKDCILIVQIPGCDKGKMVSYDSAIFDVTVQARTALMDDIDKLAKEKSVINKAMLDSDYWAYSPNGDIIISNWSSLHTIKDENYFSAFRKKIKELSGLIYYGL